MIAALAAQSPVMPAASQPLDVAVRWLMAPRKGPGGCVCCCQVRPSSERHAAEDAADTKHTRLPVPFGVLIVTGGMLVDGAGVGSGTEPINTTVDPRLATRLSHATLGSPRTW